MAKRYNLVICAICNKHFNSQNEGFVHKGKLICAEKLRMIKYQIKECSREFEMN